MSGVWGLGFQGLVSRAWDLKFAVLSLGLLPCCSMLGSMLGFRGFIWSGEGTKHAARGTSPINPQTPELRD